MTPAPTQTKQFQIVTTTHKDVSERLKQINPQMASQTRKVLDQNKKERHIRGGMATREKYLLKRHDKNDRNGHNR